MQRLSRNSLFAALVAACCLTAYVAGVAVGKANSQQGFAKVLASVQVDLGLNHLLRLRELEGDIARDCSSEALAKIQFDIHTQMLVLSSMYKEHKGTWVVDSISKREATLAAQLEQFRSSYDSWIEPKCSK